MGQDKLRMTISDGSTKKVVAVDESWVEIVNEFTEKSAYPNRSAAVRSLVILGMTRYVNDPRSKESASSQSKDFEPITIRELIPEGRENAINMTEDVPSVVKENIIDIVENDPEISRNGLEVWK